MITPNEFLQLPTEEIAELVKASGSKVVVFPFNGTRRWFMLEYGDQKFEDPVMAYIDIAQTRHIELYKLFFDHGVDTLVTPVIGPEILATRNEYMQKIGGEGLSHIANHPEFLNFYTEYDVRVHFYGDYHKSLKNTYYEYLSSLFDDIAQKTKHHNRFRLFFGAFADNLNSTNRIADFSIEYYKKHGKTPTREEIVAMYYGEYVEKANIFIGYDRFATFDYPLINWGEEDLYFTTSPSLYLGEPQLRRILYDHLYTRRTPEREYETLTHEEVVSMQKYYRSNIDNNIGIGELYCGLWIPQKSVSRKKQ